MVVKSRKVTKNDLPKRTPTGEDEIDFMVFAAALWCERDEKWLKLVMIFVCLAGFQTYTLWDILLSNLLVCGAFVLWLNIFFLVSLWAVKGKKYPFREPLHAYMKDKNISHVSGSEEYRAVKGAFSDFESGSIVNIWKEKWMMDENLKKWAKKTSAKTTLSLENLLWIAKNPEFSKQHINNQPSSD